MECHSGYDGTEQLCIATVARCLCVGLSVRSRRKKQRKRVTQSVRQRFITSIRDVSHFTLAEKNGSPLCSTVGANELFI